MFSITLTPELLQIKSMQNQCKINIKSMQKENIDKVEYGFLLYTGNWSLIQFVTVHPYWAQSKL